MIRAGLLVAVLAAVFAAPAAAVGPSPALKATVKGGDVKIVNGDSKSYAGFFINSTDSPKITAASNKACKMGTSPWSANGKKHVDYWADCKVPLAAHKSLDIKLTTSGHGAIFVWAKLGGTSYKIATGSA